MEISEIVHAILGQNIVMRVIIKEIDLVMDIREGFLE